MSFVIFFVFSLYELHMKSDTKNSKIEKKKLLSVFIFSHSALLPAYCQIHVVTISIICPVVDVLNSYCVERIFKSLKYLESPATHKKIIKGQ